MNINPKQTLKLKSISNIPIFSSSSTFQQSAS